MLKLLLKIRDKSWFYTNQLYPNDTPESNLKDFKLRFSMFFCNYLGQNELSLPIFLYS